MLVASTLEVSILLDRDELPATWTGLAERIRTATGEPRERRVLVNILATAAAMVDSKLDQLAEAISLRGASDASRSLLRSGEDSINAFRGPFTGHPNGVEYLDFEIIKAASLLASPQSMQARAERQWPAPDIWAGNVDSFPYPY
jgi:hypothetical protein